MKKIVGLIAFCVTFNVGIVPNAEAAKSFNELRLEELKKNPKVQEYIKLKKKVKGKKGNKKVDSETEEENSSIQEENRSEELNTETESENSTPNTTKKKKKKRKKKNKKQSVQNSVNDSEMYGESDTQTIDESQSLNQTTGSQKKKKKRSKKKKKKNQSSQMNQMGQMGQVNMMSQNQSNQMNQMGQANQTNSRKRKKKNRKNRSNQMNQMGQMGQANMMNQSQSNQMNQMNQMGQMRQTNSSYSNDTFVLNEPIIDGTKIKKSSMIVEKDIKLASNNETKKTEKKTAAINSINLSPLDKKEVLTHIDSEKDIKLAANFDNSDLKIKEKLQQLNNDRKTGNLIRTPDKTLKDNIQVNKFRAELDHYRKLYSANSKTA